MSDTQPTRSPLRVTDLIERHKAGAMVVCRTAFEILPVDFAHRANPFKAYIFLCQYRGTIDGSDYAFRKCYARGCPHNRCPHVSQAVLIANRYLQRDYHRLETAGISVQQKLFSLEEMLIKFDLQQKDADPAMALHDFVRLAGEGQAVSIRPTVEFVSAVEHFDRFETEMVFLMADFAVTCQGKAHRLERCLACYPIDQAAGERPDKVDLANARLRRFYRELAAAGGKVEKIWFS